MIGRLNQGVIGILAALTVLLTAGSSAASAQDGGRFRVLIPDLFPAEGTDDDFGKDVAEDLRDMMSRLATHTAIEKDDIEDQLDRFDMDMDELNCIRTRQLGAQSNAQVALCADYVRQGEEMVMSNIQFIALSNSSIFEVDGFAVNRRDHEGAAQRIFEAFDLYVQQDRFRTFCFDYANSSQWENALRNCDDALELNPTDEGVLYQRAFVLWKMERMDEALEQIQEVLAMNEYNTEALQLGGFLAASLGRDEEGRDYYERYLELNPGAVAVRRNIAYELFDAGDAEGAMLLVEQGLETEPENVELLGDLGNYAFEAARNATPAGVQTGDAEIPAETRAMYDKAIGAYMQVFEAKGDSMGVGQLRNVISAHIQMGNLQEAVTTAEQVIEVFPEEASVLAVYSTALQRADRIDEAVAALQRIEAIDPEFPNLYARQGSMLLVAGRRDDALPLLRRAVTEGNSDPNQIARTIFADAYQKGVQQENWNYALQGIQAAKEYELSDQNRQEMNFWHGYSLYQQGIAAQEPQTVESARRTMPMFQRAKELFESATGYAQQRDINLAQFLEATTQYIEIQDAIIQRGR